MNNRTSFINEVKYISLVSKINEIYETQGEEKAKEFVSGLNEEQISLILEKKERIPGNTTFGQKAGQWIRDFFGLGGNSSAARPLDGDVLPPVGGKPAETPVDTKAAVNTRIAEPRPGAGAGPGRKPSGPRIDMDAAAASAGARADKFRPGERPRLEAPKDKPMDIVTTRNDRIRDAANIAGGTAAIGAGLVGAGAISDRIQQGGAGDSAAETAIDTAPSSPPPAAVNKNDNVKGGYAGSMGAEATPEDMIGQEEKPFRMPKRPVTPTPDNSAAQAAEAPKAPSSYEVKKGDNLWNIIKGRGKASGKTMTNTEIANEVNRIAKLNKMKNPDLILPGQKIQFEETETLNSSFLDAFNRIASSKHSNIFQEAKGSTPKTAKEKELAALAEPKDKITHKDVLVGRGVVKEGDTTSPSSMGIDKPTYGDNDHGVTREKKKDKETETPSSTHKKNSPLPTKEKMQGKLINASYNKEEVEQIDEAANYDPSSKAHQAARESVKGMRSTMKAQYHKDGSASIHTKSSEGISSTRAVDHHYAQAGLGYNRPESDYKSFEATDKEGLTHTTRANPSGGHTIHIKEETALFSEAELAYFEGVGKIAGKPDDKSVPNGGDKSNAIGSRSGTLTDEYIDEAKGKKYSISTDTPEMAKIREIAGPGKIMYKQPWSSSHAGYNLYTHTDNSGKSRIRAFKVHQKTGEVSEIENYVRSMGEEVEQIDEARRGRPPKSESLGANELHMNAKRAADNMSNIMHTFANGQKMKMTKPMGSAFLIRHANAKGSDAKDAMLNHAHSSPSAFKDVVEGKPIPAMKKKGISLSGGGM